MPDLTDEEVAAIAQQVAMEMADEPSPADVGSALMRAVRAGRASLHSELDAANAELVALRLQSEQFRFALMEARGVISKALLTNKVIEQK